MISDPRQRERRKAQELSLRPRTSALTGEASWAEFLSNINVLGASRWAKDAADECSGIRGCVADLPRSFADHGDGGDHGSTLW